MSDQVEIMAAEDAPSNNEGEQTESSVQATSAEAMSEQPEATTVESTHESVPEAEAVSETPAAATPAAESSAETATSNEAVAEEAAEAVAQDAADEPQAEADTKAAAAEQDAEENKPNVRILSVGQQVTGTIKRIADFGAFVDIGVGRDGLIHISELSVRRVGKVTDVLAEGQEVTAWIKKLDRDRNRISLTLIDPNTKTIRDLNKDDIVQGTVTRILPYGAFVDIGIGRDALLHVREMGVGYVAKPEDVVKVGDTIEARIIELSRRRGRVDLSLKGLREEPEPAPTPQQEQQWVAPQSQPQRPHDSRRQPEPEPEHEDDFEDLEVLSPMELAFKRAMEAEGMELNVSRKKQGKRNRRESNRSLQDEIISRTLSSGRK
ncbi:MAG: S1 RNA-binding domain-containing protein [Caldilineaceae bacterium]|nr:S1 RNA-binding domain-containing protein [Caldilineaceae bacterium]